MLPCWRDALLRRPWALWLALLLAVVSALAPTLSHGLAAGHGSVMALQDICASNAPDRLADASTPAQPASARTATTAPMMRASFRTNDEGGRLRSTTSTDVTSEA